MNTAKASAVETQLLLALVTMIKDLHVAGALESGKSISLRCPCGKVILAPVMVQSSLKDSQRGLLKSKVERHLRDYHGVSKYTIGQILRESFATA